MKKQLITYALLFWIVDIGYAQESDKNKSAARIIGMAKNLETGKPIAYVTAALYKAGAEVSTFGAVADGDGVFYITGFETGTYELRLTFIGYETVKRTVNVNTLASDINLGEIGMKDEEVALEEVVVQGQRELIEERVDRTIYKAENDKTTAGGDATDVLRRVPMLSVDLDGNVSMRGSTSILVLVDNRPSAIAASSISDALKQIPADEIKAVEVITSPSARFDAEGTSGVINIVTKKNNLQGVTVSANTGVGIRGSNLSLRGSARKGKFGFSLGGFGRMGYNVLGSFENEQITNQEDGTLTKTLQSANTERKDLFGRYNFGLDYEVNQYNYFTGAVNFGIRNSKNRQTDFLTQNFSDDMLLASQFREIYTLNNSNSVDISLNYTRTFEKKGKELSLLTLYSTDTRENSFTNYILDGNNESVLSRLRNDNPSKNREFTIQVDYVTPLGEKGNRILEYGAKNILRKAYSDFTYYRAMGADGAYQPSEDPSLSNEFSYDQNVTAGYLSYTFMFLKNYTLKPGFRYEYTSVNADFKTEYQADIPSYGTLVPSVNASRKLKNGNMIKAAYNRRIQRPSLRYLNPNLEASNPQQLSQGNPELEPELTDNFELGYSTFIKNTTLNFTGFYRNTTGSIQPLRTVRDDGVIFTTYENIGREQAIGTSIFANINISNKFSLNGGLDTYYAILDNGLEDPLYAAQNEGIVLSGRMFGNYSLPKDWQIQLFTFARGRRVQLQGTSGGFAVYGLNFNKQFNEKRGSVGFGVENFLTKEFTIKDQITTPMIMQSSINRMRTMNFKVNFSYRIGKLSLDQKHRKRKSISNDDLKQAGGGQMEMQQN